MEIVARISITTIQKWSKNLLDEKVFYAHATRLVHESEVRQKCLTTTI
jgi:hypothetical protein